MSKILQLLAYGHTNTAMPITNFPLCMANMASTDTDAEQVYCNRPQYEQGSRLYELL